MFPFWCGKSMQVVESIAIGKDKMFLWEMGDQKIGEKLQSVSTYNLVVGNVNKKSEKLLFMYGA